MLPEERIELVKCRYLLERKTIRAIASEVDRSYSTIREFMQRHGIPRRGLSEAPVHFRKPFSGNYHEMVYLLGLRSDVHARRKGRYIEVSVASTHPAMLNLFKNVFSEYGSTYICPYRFDRGYEFGIRVELDLSFSFLVHKLERIPDWVLIDDELFYRFLAGYMDAEGCWCIFNVRGYIGFAFVITSSDAVILSQIHHRLKADGFISHLRIARKAGTRSGFGTYTRDLYVLNVYSRRDVLGLIHILLPLSHHSEKIRKMQLMLKHEHAKYWKEVEADITALRQQIKQEVTNCKREAEIEWLRRHRQYADSTSV